MGEIINGVPQPVNVGDKYVKATWFATISSGTTSGTVTKPASAGSDVSFVMDEWGSDTDALVSTMANGKPTFESPVDAGGNTITTTFNEAGEFSFSGTPVPAGDHAVIFVYKCYLKNFDADESLFESELLPGGTAILESIGTTKGDLIGFSGSSVPARLGVGTNDQVLTADSGEALGLKWATPSGGAGNALLVDGTSGRVLRGVVLVISDGTNANTLKCSVLNRWNGDAIAETDNIVKNGTTGSFYLDSYGSTFIVGPTGLSGNVLYALGSMMYNTSGVDLLTNVKTESNGIFACFYSGDTAQDITILVDTGSIYINVLYITDA